MNEAAKHAVAEAAAALVQNGMLLGLGSGSTMHLAVDAIGRRVRDEGLQITGVPTSDDIHSLAGGWRIPVVELGTSRLDLALDGADEIETGTLRLVKGRGGAMLREKMVAEGSRRFVILADSSKLVATLGELAPLPVEISRFGHMSTLARLVDLGGRPVLRANEAASPYVTDGGNYVLDCPGFAPIKDPFTLQRQLQAIAGVLATGLFLLPVEQALIGNEDGTVAVLRPTQNRGNQ